MSRHVPLFRTRIFSLVMVIAGAIMGVAAAFHANHESNVTKANAKAAVAGLNLGTTLEIDTNDVYTAGEVAGIAQLGLALVAAISILLLLIDTKKRHAVPNAPHVRKAPFSSRTLILQLLALIGANIFAIATAAVTTDFVSKRSAKVTSTFANGTVVPPTLIAALSAQLGISPVYKDQNYLVFLAIAPWIGVLFGLIATLITFHAWRRYKTSRSEAETEAEAAVETGSIYDMTEKD